MDVLFRSAAVAYRSRVMGVVLTGQLFDGAAGLAAIQTCGGLAFALISELGPGPGELPPAPVVAREVGTKLNETALEETALEELDGRRLGAGRHAHLPAE